ncbi:MAG: AAA family ATPase [Dermatophilaceae bacterium]
MGSGLVGRDREMSLLLGCLDQAQAGHAGVVVCVGEPGVGKTRLAEELTSVAGARGLSTAWGRAAGPLGVPPYWPWREALRAMVGRSPDEEDPFEHPADSAGVEPSLEERMRRFDAVSQRVLRAAQARPLLLVLDDLHSADESSQLLARHLARTAREDCLLMVVTCRDTTGPLATLAQGPRTTQVQLRGLDPGAVGQQVSTIVGRAPSEAELRTVYAATAGNPFFVGELARQMADTAGLAGGVPRSVLDAIAERLAQLSPDCVSVLQAAAILGTGFSVTVLASVTQRSLSDCLVALDEAARAALLTPGPNPVDRRFVHELVVDAIVANLDTKHRILLHRCAAIALEQNHAAHPEPVLFDLARHWAEAAVAGDQARAASWIERAGKEAMRQHAYEDARWLFSTALTVRAVAMDDLARCRLMLSLAAAQSLSSDFGGALQTCAQVADLAVRLGAPELAGEAALVAEPTFDPEVDQTIRALCDKALAVLGQAPAALRARVLAQYAVVCDHLSDLDAANPAVEEALALAEDSGDANAIEAALTAHHMVRSGPDGLEEREANADRMWALGTRIGSATACLAASEWRFDAACERGELSRAAREVEVIAHWASRIGGPMSRWRLLRCRAMLAQARGRFADAYRYGAEALATMEPTGFPAAFLLWGGFLSVTCHHTGQTTESLGASGVTDADAAQQDWPLPGVVPTLAPAAQLAEVGRLREASLVYRRLGPATDWQESPHAQLFTWAIGIETAIAVGAHEDVVTLRGKLAPYRGHHIVNGRYAMAYLGPAELWLGTGAAYLGLVDEAVADLEHAVKLCAANGAEGCHAEAEYQLASALVRRSAPGDQQRARSLLVGSLPRMDALGMPPLRAAAAALLSRIDTDPSVALTRREVEVADLVAQGMTNREIATRLYLSERTAQNHVQHILDKLTLANRSQIAVWVQERRLSRSAE